MTLRIPLTASTFEEEEIQAAIAVLRSGQFTLGKLCAEFEANFARYVGSKNAIFVNSGSSANLLAFFALSNWALPLSQGKRRLEPGSEVIVPALTWSTTVWPIVQAGGVPVLVDCDPLTLQMDVHAVEAAISERTVAICPVHVLGNAVPMAPLLELAEKNHLWMIEDTCEALGTRHDERFVGTFGQIGTYSFFFSHHISTIEGGMLVTDNDELADLLRCLRAHGWTRHLKNREAVERQHADLDPRFLFINTGFNLRPTEINAAFGLKQLPKLAGFNERRREVAQEWNRKFFGLQERGLLQPMVTTPGTESTWFGYPVLCRDTGSRDRLRAHLESKHIETRPVICGNLARQPAFQHISHRVVGSLAGADRVMDTGLYWGSHPLMTQADVDYVASTVLKFFE